MHRYSTVMASMMFFWKISGIGPLFTSCCMQMNSDAQRLRCFKLWHGYVRRYPSQGFLLATTHYYFCQISPSCWHRKFPSGHPLSGRRGWSAFKTCLRRKAFAAYPRFVRDCCRSWMRALVVEKNGASQSHGGGYPWAYNEIGQLETWGNHDKPSGFRGTPLVLDKPIWWHILIWCRIHKFIPRELTMCVAADPNDGSLLIGGGFTWFHYNFWNPQESIEKWSI